VEDVVGQEEEADARRGTAATVDVVGGQLGRANSQGASAEAYQAVGGAGAQGMIGAQIGQAYHLCLLAHVYLAASRFEDGLGVLAEVLDPANQYEERVWEAETHRLKGELLLQLEYSNATEAQSCFRRAIEIARNQNSKSWELRATMSLARLLTREGRRNEASAMLAEIYDWFTEGFDTADLKDAKALLDELNE
jgi:predicted ATPase